MNDEIREILDKLSNRKQETLIMGLRQCQLKNIEHPFITKEEYIDKILDYITNLQQENHELKSKLECYENGAYYSSKVDELEQENERLKETNVYCNRTDCVGRIKDSRKYDSVYQEKEDYKSRCEKAYSYVDNVPISHYEKGYMEDGILISKRVIKNILQNGSEKDDK